MVQAGGKIDKVDLIEDVLPDEEEPLLSGFREGGEVQRANSYGGSEDTIVAASDDGAELPGQVEDEDKLPKVQIFLLSLARMVEPMVFFVIFPF